MYCYDSRLSRESKTTHIQTLPGIFTATAKRVGPDQCSSILLYRLPTKKAEPSDPALEFAEDDGWLTFPEPPPASQPQEAGAEEEQRGRDRDGIDLHREHEVVVVHVV